MAFAIRRLGADDAEGYRTLRLEALATVPDAFADSFEAASARPDTYWQELVSGERAFFGAFAGDDLHGAVNYMAERGDKLRHKGWLLGLYVRPALRGTGAGMALIEAVLGHAREAGARQVMLGVATDNAPALGLYERAGFERYGTEKRALLIGERFIDEHFMVRFLDEDKNDE